MRIIKFEHAALAIEKGDRRVVVDPGSFLASLTDLSAISAVVITHEHPDHVSPGNLARIRESNPTAPIYAPQGVATAYPDAGITVVCAGDRIEHDGFTFEFFGGTHAVIHESIPVIDNLGVMIDDIFFYPGDSFTIPEGRVIHALAAPLGAPWLKISEAIDYVLAIAPRHAFGTHDMTLSVAGQEIHRQRLDWATHQGGGTFHALAPGDAIDL